MSGDMPASRNSFTASGVVRFMKKSAALNRIPLCRIFWRAASCAGVPAATPLPIFLIFASNAAANSYLCFCQLWGLAVRTSPWISSAVRETTTGFAHAIAWSNVVVAPEYEFSRTGKATTRADSRS